ncbi:hypothetical protein GCM10009430_27770 [Aquimarina litoralis]|uniref:Uncharacterized protein n=1 Tax=Aquimarina litoralis TaxID=584605 RepID=A0ABP3U6V5_9FLAO
MSKDIIGFEIDLEEGDRIVEIQTSPELKEYFKKQFEKNHTYYLTEFIGGKKNYDIAYNTFVKAMRESLPFNIEENCKFCKGEGKEIGDKSCQKFYLQMDLTYIIAASEFINLVFKNKYIYNDKPKLQKLTVKFFDCLRFIKNEGKMYFELEQMCRYTLNSGFLTLSQMLANSEKLNAYKIINRTLDELNEEELQNKVLRREDENYLDLQKEFFENKLRYFKEELYLEEKDNQRLQKENPKKEKQVRKNPSILQYALYYYYLQQSKDFPHFENHPEGKVRAIEELIKNANLNTTQKYFQLRYNKIANHKTNRVALNQVKNIGFVANTMLKEFPKAQKIALSDLEEAKTKNR